MLLLLAAAAPVAADETGTPPPGEGQTNGSSEPVAAPLLPRNEPVIVEVTFNHVKRGAYPLVITEQGDYLLRGSDLELMGVVPPYGTPVTIGAETFYSLRQMQAADIRLDENWLSLNANLPPQRMPRQIADLRRMQSAEVIRPRDNSAFFNYRLQNSGNDAGGPESWVAGGEVGIRYRDSLFQSQSAYIRYGDTVQNVRYGTSITHDNRNTLQRLIVGDFVTSSGNLGNTLNIGGISFSKSYAIDPYFVKQPTAGFVSTIIAPSEVEIYLDGSRLRSSSLQPGEFELKNFNYYGGRHDLQMVIRDSFGREQTVTYPYYFSDQNLRQGLHDYSYNFGRMRVGVGSDQDSYEDWAFSAYHRYGVTDHVTLGMRAEATAARNNFGPTAVWRFDRWGVFSAAASRSSSEGSGGWAGAVGYGYQDRRFNLQSSARHYTETYQVVTPYALIDRPRQELALAAGYALNGLGNLGVSMRSLSYYTGTDRRTESFSYSRTLYRMFNLMAVAGRETTATTSSPFFYLTLSYFPSRGLNTLLRHERYGDSYTDSLQVGKTTPSGEGLGYRLTTDRTVAPSGETTRVSPWAQYNGHYGIYTANVQYEMPEAAEERTVYQWGVSGGVAYVGDSVHFSRPISDSFAVVQVGDLEGVRVYQSSQLIDRTDRHGQVFLPNLGSYLHNRISVDDRDIPIDYEISKRSMNVSPPLRSGTQLNFEIERFQAVYGTLRVKVDNAWVPAAFGEVAVELKGKRQVAPLGVGGEFYLENLAAGSYRVQVDYQGSSCDFELVIPKSSDALLELGEMNGCEIPR